MKTMTTIEMILDDSSEIRAKYRGSVLNVMSSQYSRDLADIHARHHNMTKKTCNWCGRLRKTGCCLGR